jgi:hypothetical protein
MMMFASRDRSAAIRRLLPQNRSARDVSVVGTVGHNAGEDLCCCGGAPARREGLGHSGADRAMTEMKELMR